MRLFKKKEVQHYTTPSNKYWGFTENPFSDDILKGDLLTLFVNREFQLATLEDNIGHRIIGVYGHKGAGKSSCLRKFESNISGSLYTVFCRIKTVSKEYIYREILHSILKSDIIKSIKFRKPFNLESQTHLERLEGDYKEVIKNEAGIDQILVRKGTDETSQEYKAHTEESAIRLLDYIFDNLEEPLIVIVDDFDRIKFTIDNQSEYINYISLFVGMIDDTFSSKMVTFFVTLDSEMVNLIHSEKENGYFNFSFGDLVEIRNLPPFDFAEVIKKRLIEADTEIKKFMSVDAFWVLYIVTGGHLRKVLDVITKTMRNIMLKGGETFINAEDILEIYPLEGTEFDEVDLRIINAIDTSGSINVSDDDFLNTIGLTRPAVSSRIEKLMTIIPFNTLSRKSGKTTKTLYSLPKIDF